MDVEPLFEWDENKNRENILKHGVSFEDAQHVFLDKSLIVARDLNHSTDEDRFFGIGLDRAGDGILTVRFTWRGGKIRIIGAGYWRKEKKIYEEKNQIHK